MEGEPAVVEGIGALVELVVAAPVVAPSSRDDGAARRAALAEAVRSAFRPGDRFSVTIASSSGEERLDATENLDAVVAFLRVGFEQVADVAGPAGVSDALKRELDARLSAWADDGTPGPTLAEGGSFRRELIVVAPSASIEEALTPTLVELSIRSHAPISILAIGPANTEGGVCSVAHDTGGRCATLGIEDGQSVEELDAASLRSELEGLLSAVQSVFVATIPCVEGELAEPVRLRAGAGEPSEISVEAARLGCDTYRQFDPGYTPPPEPVVEPEAEDEQTGIGWPIVAVGIVGAIGMLALLIVVRARRRSPAFDGAMSEHAGRDVDAIRRRVEAMPDNEEAAARTLDGTVAERPAWLREPSVIGTRNAIRRTPLADVGWHVLAAVDDEVERHVVPASGLVIGARDGVMTRRAGTTAVTLRRTDRGLSAEFDDSAGAVELNGRAVSSGAAIRAGDELVVDRELVIEVRYGAADSPEPALRPGMAPATRIIRCDVPEAFGAFRVGPVSTVVGRDPLPYEGVNPQPGLRRISEISNDHAEVWVSGGVLYVRDLGSSNGTYVGEDRLEPFAVHAVASGDSFVLSRLIAFSVE